MKMREICGFMYIKENNLKCVERLYLFSISLIWFSNKPFFYSSRFILIFSSFHYFLFSCYLLKLCFSIENDVMKKWRKRKTIIITTYLNIVLFEKKIKVLWRYVSIIELCVLAGPAEWLNALCAAAATISRLERWSKMLLLCVWVMRWHNDGVMVMKRKRRREKNQVVLRN